MDESTSGRHVVASLRRAVVGSTWSRDLAAAHLETMMKRLALLGSLVLALTGCYETPRPNCAFACGPAPDFACPDGYACQDDNSVT